SLPVPPLPARRFAFASRHRGPPRPRVQSMSMDRSDLNPRRSTTTTWVGAVPLGSGHPVVVQSMTNTDTGDAAGTAQQVADLARAGSEIVRVTVNDVAAARAIPEIRSRLDDMGLGVPLVGDFHFNGHKLLVDVPEAARTLDKYRINPGNVGPGRRHDENFATIIDVARDNGKPVRIGVNWGSLDQSLLTAMMDENAARAVPESSHEVLIEAMLASALLSAAL